jgi:serine/threonine protein kinase
MDFVNGGSLAFHLDKKKQFDEARVKFYSAQIVCGLLYLHSKNFIYELK